MGPMERTTVSGFRRTRDPHLGKGLTTIHRVSPNAFYLVRRGAPVRRVPLRPPISPEWMDNGLDKPVRTAYGPVETWA